MLQVVRFRVAHGVGFLQGVGIMSISYDFTGVCYETRFEFVTSHGNELLSSE